MSSIYSPYADDVEEQHRHSIRHKYSAIAHPRYGDPFELEVEDCSVSSDISWSPYFQGELTAKVIEDQEILDSLDPRNGCRVSVYMGYVYDGFIDDVNLVADLHLRSRTVDRPSNTIKLVLSSDESCAQDYKRMSWDSQPPLTGINEFVKWHADIAQRPTVATVVSDFPAGYGSAQLAGMVMEPGQDSLSMLTDAAERLNVRIWCDGNRVWHVSRKSEYVGTSALKLTTGASGTILDASTTLTRGESQGTGFHNAVCLKYSWRDGAGVEQVIFGNAAVTSGTYSVANGPNGLFEERNYPIGSTALANAAASNLLSSLVARGKQISITAHAAYWLKPGHTVTLQLPTGDQERLLVRQVTFNPVSGTMNLALNQPINVSISTSG